jgi:hypothetical protein
MYVLGSGIGQCALHTSPTKNRDRYEKTTRHFAEGIRWHRAEGKTARGGRQSGENADRIKTLHTQLLSTIR